MTDRRFARPRAIALAAVLGLAGMSGAARAETSGGYELTCTGVFAADASIDDLRAAFGAAMVTVEQVPGVEGTTEEATVLHAGTARRRLEVIWLDAAERRRPIQLTTRGSDWRYAGIGPGSTLDEVVRQNGAPIMISGFGWDLGGFVMSFGGGQFDAAPNGCRLTIRFAPAEGIPIPDRLEGDGVEIRSDDKALRKLKLKVEEISLGRSFPESQ